jgi:hypothetical protein
MTFGISELNDLAKLTGLPEAKVRALTKVSLISPREIESRIEYVSLPATNTDVGPIFVLPSVVRVK